MKANELALYLREHPEFFTTYGDVFAQMTVPHPHGGQAITLVERQLHTLREKIGQLEAKLAELISFGEENDDIGAKVHRLSVNLIGTQDYPVMRETLFTSLLEDFSVPYVALRVWNSPITYDNDDFSPVSDELRFYAGDLVQPYCGVPENHELLSWFGEAAPKIASVALIPLIADDRTFGLLGLASNEIDRFYPDMGRLYLSRIGELCAATIRRELG